MSQSYAPTLPQAVRDAAARATELMKPAAADPAQQGQPTVPVQPPGHQQEQPNGPLPNPPVPTPDQQPQVPPEPASEGKTEDWEHRFRSEKGRRERLEAQVRELADQTASLRAVIAAQSAGATPSSPPPPEVKPFTLSDDDQLTDQERADYGTDLLKVVGKQAKQIVAQATAPLLAEIERLRAQQGGVAGFVQQTAQDRFIAGLDATEPQWRQLNNNDGFLDWLDEMDPYAGAPRKVMFDVAVSERNHTRAAAFFRGYLQQQGATAPQAGEPGASSPPADAAGDSRPTLADLAAPGRAKGAGAQAPAEKPIWTSAEISAFYDDVRRGKFSGRDAEKKAYEADIIAATKEGRIRHP